LYGGKREYESASIRSSLPPLALFNLRRKVYIFKLKIGIGIFINN